jgi:hypothetical protein
MNVARLSQRFYSRYFELLARYSSSQSVDVASLARELSSVDAEDEQSLQFSFASKLAHMIDPRLPVYDRFVAAFYFYVAPAGDGQFEARLVELMGFYNFLRHEYARVLGERLLSGAIQKFRERFTDDIPDERIVDWLLWAWVSLLRRGAQRQGQNAKHDRENISIHCSPSRLAPFPSRSLDHPIRPSTYRLSW